MPPLPLVPRPFALALSLLVAGAVAPWLPARATDPPAAPAAPAAGTQSRDPRGDEIARSGKGCEECHRTLTPTLHETWRTSAHGAKGITCEACHGRDHSTIFSHKGQVSAATCGKCHAKAVAEFGSSLHAISAQTMLSDPKFQALSPTMGALGCDGCHQLGAVSDDGSVGKCNHCHSGHAFSVAEARSPEACAACHGGPDHPHMEMWRASKHGQLYASASTRASAPTCVTCHMPGGTHDTSRGLTLGTVANGAVLEGEPAPVRMRTISRAEFRQQRAHMAQTCLPCHSSRFAAESLERADQVKREADALLARAVDLIGQLAAEGLLRRPTADDSATPASTVAELQVPGHALVLGGDQQYAALSPAEQIFFEMYKFHHATTFKGAYHHSPEFTHNRGWLAMQRDFTALQHEAERLRAERSPLRGGPQPRGAAGRTGADGSGDVPGGRR